MTIQLDATPTASSPPLPAVWTIGPARLLVGLDSHDRLRFADHVQVHGPHPRLSRQQYERLAQDVGLLGRGGAGFPVARKLAALPASGVRAVVVNGSESEPASWKDRMLMRRTPHLLLDGAIGVAQAVGAADVIVVVHDEESIRSMRAAVDERADAARVRVVGSPGRFVSGEATAVIRAAAGTPALPSGRRVLPTDKGYADGPTFLSNAETFAQLAVLARLGPRYRDTGLSIEPGTTLVTVGGAVAHPGVVEIPTGMPLDLLLQVVGATPDATILLGGYHGSFVADPSKLWLSRPALASCGASLGAGVVLALGAETCALAELSAVVQWLASQSAGQCGPCVFGLPSLAHDLRQLLSGDPLARRVLERHLNVIAGRGACAHPDGVTRFVTSALQTFHAEIQQHLENRGCGRVYRGQLPLPGSTGGNR
jgi:NADH:ubiquinone oxidoreductase subunit F (NADH-binding)